MSYVLIRTRSNMVARVEHRCTWCGEAIKQRAKYDLHVYKHGRDFNRDSFHPECGRASRRLDVDEEFMPYSMMRGRVYERDEVATLGEATCSMDSATKAFLDVTHREPRVGTALDLLPLDGGK